MTKKLDELVVSKEELVSKHPPAVTPYTTLRDLTSSREEYERRRPVAPPAQKDDPTTLPSQRGRILIFGPTKEKVTVVRENVGQNYSGEWVSEVISRDGKKFLAASKQLKEKA